MGEIIKIHCNTCRKNWEHMTGCGLQHGSIGNVIAAFKAKEQKQIIDWCQTKPIPLYDFRYQIAVCNFCKDLVNVPVLRGSDENVTFVGTCPICHGLLQTPPLEAEEVSDAACPSCGNTTLTIEEVGHWD